MEYNGVGGNDDAGNEYNAAVINIRLMRKRELMRRESFDSDLLKGSLAATLSHSVITCSRTQ